MRFSGEKILALLIIPTLVLSLLASCSKSSGSGTLKSGKITMLLNQSWSGVQRPELSKVITLFEKEYPGSKLELQVIPDAQYSDVFRTKIATNRPPDIFYDGLSAMSRNMDMASKIVNLTNETWAKQLNAANLVTLNNVVYGSPIGATGGYYGIVYNRTMYNKLGLKVPTSVDEFYANCEAIKKSGVNPVVLTGKDDWTIGMWDVTLFASTMALNPNYSIEKLNRGEVKYADVPVFADAINVMKQLLDKGYFNKDYLSTTYDMGENRLMDDQSCMMLMADSTITDLKQKKTNADDFAMFPFPMSSDSVFACSSTPAFFISKSSKRIDLCKAFLNIAARPEINKLMAVDWGVVPGFTTTPYTMTPAMKEVVDTYTSKHPAVPEWGVTCAVDIGQMTKEIQQVLLGDETAQQALVNWDKYFGNLAKERKLPGWS